jgi:hypothetical protein
MLAAIGHALMMSFAMTRIVGSPSLRSEVALVNLPCHCRA